jgi:hypothetical protein
VSELYEDTVILRRTVSAAKVETLVDPAWSAPDGSYRKVTVLAGGVIIWAVDHVDSPEQLAEEKSPGEAIGEGLTQTEWPVLASNAPVPLRLRPCQRLRAMAKEDAGAGLVNVTVIIEYRRTEG